MASEYAPGYPNKDPYQRQGTNFGQSGDAWANWDEYMKQMSPDINDFPRLKERAAAQSQLYYNPAYRELASQRKAAGTSYKYGKAEIAPEYARFVAEQRAGLGGQRAATELARGQVGQDYDVSTAP